MVFAMDMGQVQEISPPLSNERRQILLQKVVAELESINK